MKRLRVAIVHHHLRGGGVTKVIERSVQALSGYPVDVCVLTGEKISGETVLTEGNVAVIEELSYGANVPVTDAETLNQKLVMKAQEMLGAEPDVWHIHNHSLGKNARYTEAVTLLAEQGKKVVYQIHDFAEDNRPGNYEYLKKKEVISGERLIDRMYPTADNIRYAVLNSKDRKALTDAGINEEKASILKNPVEITESVFRKKRLPAELSEKKVLIYPVRAIPRKNIGEIVLWSILEMDKIHMGITLAPKNPVYKSDYDEWVKFTKEHSLPVTFEAGKHWGLKYPELIDAADGIITTSIAEGFGLVYLESWLAEKPLYGRVISELVEDFKKEGVEFPGMYDKLEIPVNWLEREKLETDLRAGIIKALISYGKEPKEKTIEKWMSKILEKGRVDFGRLSSEIQREVLLKLINEPERRADIKMELSNEIHQSTIMKNKDVVQKKYSLKGFGTDLLNVYEELAGTGSSPVKYLDPDRVLKQFLSPKDFSLLRI